MNSVEEETTRGVCARPFGNSICGAPTYSAARNVCFSCECKQENVCEIFGCGRSVDPYGVGQCAYHFDKLCDEGGCLYFKYSHHNHCVHHLPVEALDRLCKGITMSGERCKRNAEPHTNVCRQHKNQEGVELAAMATFQCHGITALGEQCQSEPAEYSDFCLQHEPQEDLRLLPMHGEFQCRGRDRGGNPCPNKASDGFAYCVQHVSAGLMRLF